MRCHLKLKKISSFKAVTRKQPFLCKNGNPATEVHILIFEGEPETVAQIVARLRRLDPTLSLCTGCAAVAAEMFYNADAGLKG